MATLLAHIRVANGTEERFETIARELFSTSHATESALLRYEYWRATEPGSYYALLAFDDFHGFIAHQCSAHHEQASPELGQVIESIRLEWLDPVQGASPLPITATQVPAPDADPLTLKYSKVFAAQIAEWWMALR